MKNKLWINDIAGENSDEIEKHIKENYFDFITYLFDHSNNIILEHEKNLKENHLQKYYKVSEYFDQWKNIYENNK
ncbi:MAG: hypothetical protein HDR43_00420 [Mycoplasma sp.]|nr:hypothetical protein [Mycoplasma sp.]